jgi:hypothetical protein
MRNCLLIDLLKTAKIQQNKNMKKNKQQTIWPYKPRLDSLALEAETMSTRLLIAGPYKALWERGGRRTRSQVPRRPGHQE